MLPKLFTYPTLSFRRFQAKYDHGGVLTRNGGNKKAINRHLCVKNCYMEYLHGPRIKKTIGKALDRFLEKMIVFASFLPTTNELISMLQISYIVC